MKTRQRKRNKIRGNKRIVFYGRIALEDQLGSGKSALRLQLSFANEWLRIIGLPELRKRDIFFDAGYPGTNLKRPALTRLLNQVRKKEIGGILVTELDRLSRNPGDGAWLLDFFESHGVSLTLLLSSISIEIDRATLRKNSPPTWIQIC